MRKCIILLLCAISMIMEAQSSTSLPYEETFESYTSNDQSALTSNGWVCSSNNQYAYSYVTDYASNVHNGSKALAIYNGSNQNATQTLTIPLTTTLAGKDIVLWYKNSGTSSSEAYLEVGYIVSSQFTSLSTLQRQSSYTEFVYNYPNSVPSGAKPAIRSTGAHSVYVDDIHINNVDSTVFYDTICSGASYNLHGFNYASMPDGDSELKRLIKCSTSGCYDSIIIVNIHAWSENTDYYVTICNGGSYTFYGSKYTQQGTYTWYGGSGSNCISETLHLTVSLSQGNVYDYACQDVPYYGYGVNGVIVTKDTVIDITTKDAYLCDSVTYVHLTFIPTVYGYETVTIEPGESYTWHYNSYNTAGDYKDTLASYLGCDSVCTLHLTVTKKSAVDNAASDVEFYYVSGRIYNPEGVELFVYSTEGRLVKSADEDIDMTGLPQGMYFVRDERGRCIKVVHTR